MARFRWLLPIFVALTLVSKAHAYDEDTHFYSTYAMARFAGIKHEVAMKIALSTQWMDECYLSDPTSMLTLGLGGVHKRRLLHFPSPRVVGDAGAKVQRGALGFDDFFTSHKELIVLVATAFGFKGDVEKLGGMSIWTKTTPAYLNPFASELFSEGLRDGDLMKAAAGLHVIEDSYAHAGTPAGAGHFNQWHWPDRPFEDAGKYSKMVESVMSAMVAIRELLPAQAIDISLNSIGNNQPNAVLDADTLARAYNAKIIPVISQETLKDPDYVKRVLKDLLQELNENRALMVTDEQINNFIEEINVDGTFDAYEGLRRILRNVLVVRPDKKFSPSEIRALLVSRGMLGKDATDADQWKYISSYGREKTTPDHPDTDSMKNFIASLADAQLLYTVPHALDHYNRNELEDDKGVGRKEEMRIRIANMQKFISHEFPGTNIEFLGNNSKDELGFGNEIRKEAGTAQPENPKPNIIYATFNGEEKYHFDNVIFHFLLPSQGEDDLKHAVEVIHNYKLAKNSGMPWSLYKVPLAVRQIRNLLFDYKDRYLHDILLEHQTGRADNLEYQNPVEFKQNVDTGVYKPLLAQDDFWTLDSDGVVRPKVESTPPKRTAHVSLPALQ